MRGVRTWMVIASLVAVGCGGSDTSPGADGGGVRGDGGGGSTDGAVADGGGATTGLVDCEFRGEGFDTPLCNSTVPRGSVGSGPALTDEVGRGFVEGRRLIVPAFDLERSGMPDTAAIYAIDLDTGNRTVISGYVEDPRTGGSTVGEGPELGGNTTALARLSDGDILAFERTPEPSVGLRLVRVDPTSGARTLVVEYADDSTLCGFYTFGGTVDENDRAYVTYAQGPTNVGIARVNLDTLDCEIVSAKGEGARGTGPEWFAGIRGITYGNGKIYVADFETQSVLEVDPETGNRIRISRGNPPTMAIGTGPNGICMHHLYFDGDSLVNSGQCYVPYNVGFSRIDIASGDRVQPELANRGVPLGDGDVEFYPFPGRSWLVAVDGSDVVVVDPATSRANRISG